MSGDHAWALLALLNLEPTQDSIHEPLHPVQGTLLIWLQYGSCLSFSDTCPVVTETSAGCACAHRAASTVRVQLCWTTLRQERAVGRQQTTHLAEPHGTAGHNPSPRREQRQNLPGPTFSSAGAPGALLITLYPNFRLCGVYLRGRYK
jgi:hypothetical protein